jgi:hypothetical protein
VAVCPFSELVPHHVSAGIEGMFCFVIGDFDRKPPNYLASISSLISEK